MSAYDGQPNLVDEIRKLKSRVATLERQTASLNAELLVPEWRLVGQPGEPAFESGWTNAFSGADPVGFYRDPFGVVHLRGGAISTSIGALGLFSLPVGYRPNPAVGISVPGSGSNAADWFNITAVGRVEASTSVSASTYVSLWGIQFRAQG